MENDKRFNEFFSDVLRRRPALSEGEITVLQGLFFPGVYAETENGRIMESTKDMMGSYMVWEAEQAKKQEAAKPLPPMSVEEIDAISDMF